MCQNVIAFIFFTSFFNLLEIIGKGTRREFVELLCALTSLGLPDRTQVLAAVAHFLVRTATTDVERFHANCG